MLWKFHEVKAITFDQSTTFDQITTKYGYAMKKFPVRSTYLNVMWRLQIYEVWAGVR